MSDTIWISYDLGVRGDYANLYRWLDNVHAVECGDGLAHLKLEVPEGASPPDFVLAELNEHVTFSKTDRIYVIWKDPDGSGKGRFVIGKRKASPWQGLGDSAESGDDL